MTLPALSRPDTGFDWSQTPLGPAELWSDELRRSVDAALGDRGKTAAPAPAAMLDALFRSAPVGLAIWDRDFRFARVNNCLAQMNGLSVDDHLGRRLPDLLPDIAGLEQLLDQWQEILGGGKSMLNVEVFGATPGSDGQRSWNEHFFPIRLGDEIVGIGAVVEETTERRRAEAALKASEARFREFAEASSDILWLRNTEDAKFEFLSKTLRALFAQGGAAEDDDGAQFDWLDAIIPEDRDVALAELREALKGKRVTHSFRARIPGSSRIRWLKNTAFPLYDPDGIIRRIGGIAQDVTEEQETEQRLRMLIAELQHRTRNLMGVVQAVAESTLEASSSLEAFEAAFAARIAALSRAQNLLSRLEGLERIRFDELLRTELNAFGALPGDDPRVTLDGPTGIKLRSGSIQTLALALHELTTNSLKYGALSQPDARLDVRWNTLAPDAGGRVRLAIAWTEQGVAMPARAIAPVRGQGRELIEIGLAHQLDAEVRYSLTDDGVACTITLPIFQAQP